jgi:hypothetical protein
MAKSTIGFSVYLNGKLVDEVKLDRPIINIGKLSTSTLRVDDVNVSRKHAVVEQREDGSWRITDLGSTNGTLIRGERITQCELHDGDRLVLGTTTIVVHLDAGASAGATARPAASAANLAAVSGMGPKGLDAAAADGATSVIDISKIPGLALPAQSEGLAKLGDNAAMRPPARPETPATPTLEVALVHGDAILSVRTYERATDITVGSAPGTQFKIPSEVLGGEQYTLLRAVDGEFALNLANKNLTGDFTRGAKVLSLGEVASERPDRMVKLAAPTRARVEIGSFSLVLRYGEQSKVFGTQALLTQQSEPLVSLLFSAIVHMGLILIMLSLPEDLLFLTRDERAARDNSVQAVHVNKKEVVKKEEAKKEEKKEEKKDLKKIYDPTAKTETKLAERAKPDAKKEDRPPSLVDRLNRQHNEQALQEFNKLSAPERQAKAREMAQNTALATELRTSPALATLLASNSPSDFKIAAPGVGKYDPLAQNDPTNNFDPFGQPLNDGGMLTPSGNFGPGGPTGPGGPLVANVFDKRPDGPGGTLRDVNFTDKPLEPKLVELPSRISGELDEKLVQQYIRRHLNEIKWCYQDRLQQNRKLTGKLTLAFTILPSGHVGNPHCTNSTLGDAALESCIANKMSRWKFPQPSDGGVVEVAYPVILKTQ